MTLTRTYALAFKKELESVYTMTEMNVSISPSIVNHFSSDAPENDFDLVNLRVYRTNYDQLPKIFEIAGRNGSPDFFVLHEYIIFY